MCELCCEGSESLTLERRMKKRRVQRTVMFRDYQVVCHRQGWARHWTNGECAWGKIIGCEKGKTKKSVFIALSTAKALYLSAREVYFPVPHHHRVQLSAEYVLTKGNFLLSWFHAYKLHSTPFDHLFFASLSAMTVNDAAEVNKKFPEKRWWII